MYCAEPSSQAKGRPVWLLRRAKAWGQELTGVSFLVPRHKARTGDRRRTMLQSIELGWTGWLGSNWCGRLNSQNL